MNDLELEVAPKKRDRIAELERRVARCEEVARNYQMMFEQLERHIKTLADRHGNIQALYDYMVKVGSTVVTKRTDYVAFLNANNDPKRLNRKNKFNVGDTVFRADELNNKVTKYVIKSIDFIDKHPRYCLENMFGYADESTLFATEKEALNQLREWSDSR